MDTFRKSVSALFIMFGLIMLGWFIYAGINTMAYRDRQVVVRGLAEKEVMANKVTWPLVVKTVGNDLQQVYGQVNSYNAIVVKFLKDNGISDKEISFGEPKVFDKDAQTYHADVPYRYNVTEVITVTSTQVEKVNALIKRQVELLKLGVAISNDYEYKTVYEYTGLNEVKPAMIAEATRNAREAAAKFAEDSHCNVGSIKSASQGQFSIEDRDAYTPWIKNIRVVTSVTYYLEKD
ncbi:MAG: SIMPL domain-containing protein [Prevotellaceae bacterium]|nr:SIMPL domain-containing protein [Prevotellaceae bacterium]